MHRFDGRAKYRFRLDSWRLVSTEPSLKTVPSAGRWRGFARFPRRVAEALPRGVVSPVALEDAKERRAARLKMTAEERRHQIATTAAGLFDRLGYSAMTMDDIARAIGIAKPTLYHYFSSKDQILTEIHQEVIDLLITRHEERLKVRLGPEQLLLEVMADILELWDTHRGYVSVFFDHHRELPPEVQQSIHEKRVHYERMVESIWRRLVCVTGHSSGTGPEALCGPARSPISFGASSFMDSATNVRQRPSAVSPGGPSQPNRRSCPSPIRARC
jgi:AcrR family transcriptional regulator